MTFQTNDVRQLTIRRARGDVYVHGGATNWELLDATGSVNDGVLTIENARDDVVVQVPESAVVVLEQVSGDALVERVGQLSALGVSGDVRIRHISGEARLRDVRGDLRAEAVGTLLIDDAQRHGGGDVSLSSVQRADCSIVGGDLTLRNVASALIGSVNGDADAVGGRELVISSISGDVDIRDSPELVVRVLAIGGDLECRDVQQVECTTAGGDVNITRVSGGVSVGTTGGDVNVDCAGPVRVQMVGGDLDIVTGEGYTLPKTVGGSFEGRGPLLLDGDSALSIGGDCTFTLPASANVTLQITAGGDISGDNIPDTQGMQTLVYGTGEPRIMVMAGGSVHIRSTDGPRSASGTSWRNFGSGFGKLGSSFGKLGADIGREVSAAMRDAFSATGEARGRRIQVQANGREWVMDSERIERLKEEARQAAEGGIRHAISAMEEALAGMGVPRQPGAPATPESPVAPPAAATPEAPVAPPAPPAPVAVTGVTQRMTPPEPVDVEQQRAAILQMVAEGRISADEGEMLLEALG